MIGRTGIRLAILAGALMLSGLASSSASAAVYSVSLSPQTAPSGSRATIEATIGNDLSDTVGSVDLTAPAGFALVGASIAAPSTATVVGSTVQLRDLDIDFQDSKTVTLTVDLTCSPTTAAQWTAVAKRTGDFSGLPLLGLGATTQATTTTTGACTTAFVAPPADAEAGAPITALDFDPDAVAVAVTVLDGAGARLTRDNVAISLALAAGVYSGPLGGTTVRSTVDGVASFPGVSVASEGAYALIASSGGVSASISQTFRVEQDAVVCQPNVACGALATVSGAFGPGQTPYFVGVNVSAADNPATNDDGGVLTASFNTQPPLDCAGYTERAPDTAVVLGLNREKVMTLTVSASLMAASPGTLQACVGLPYHFQTRLLTPAAVHVDTNGDGVKDQYVGQLRTCFELLLGLLVTPPCVSQRGTDAAGNKFITIRVPADPLDPRIRG